jgi:hypothetical protein
LISNQLIRTYCCFGLLSCALNILCEPVNADPLKGGVEQTGIRTGAQGTGLTGGASGWNQPLNGQQGRIDQSQQPLQGAASGNNPMQLNAANDPDAGNEMLDIEWNRWRNNLMQTIQAGTLAKINVHNDVHFVWDPRTQMMQSRYPNGTSSWYALSVLPNRRIINIRLTQMSRYPSYDQAVFQSINDLQGSPILQYPNGSQRQIVSQEGNVSTAPQSSSQEFQFGDVERRRR